MMRRLGVFTILALVVMMTPALVGPAGAVDRSQEVRVTATYAPTLEVTFPADAAFGSIAVLPYNDERPLDFTIDSSLPFTSRLLVTDYSSGLLTMTTPGAFVYYRHYQSGSASVQLLPGIELDADMAGDGGVYEFQYAVLLRLDPGIPPGTLDIGLLFTVSQGGV